MQSFIIQVISKNEKNNNLDPDNSVRVGSLGGGGGLNNVFVCCVFIVIDDVVHRGPYEAPSRNNWTHSVHLLLEGCPCFFV